MMLATTNSARFGRWLATLVISGSLVSAAAHAQQGSAEAGQTKAATCAACHGPDGNSVTPDWPMLAGQHAAYIVKQLKAFKNGDRQNVTMKPFADMLSDQDMADIAAYFSAQKPSPKGADPALVNLGQQIYRGGIPQRGIAACIACHGPTGDGNPLAAYPRLSGQHSTYVARTLGEYAAGTRRSDVDVNQMMRNEASLLRDDEIKALASYVQGLN
ncbi:MAG TPA: c-type cytochrome [Gammaproteobacteria bacterium]|nr:c-type cytochrome [Gammaproteobacteria bacterium]